MKKVKKLAVIYCRTATTEKEDRAKLKEQERICKSALRKNKHELFEVISDFGYSGRTPERPGLHRLQALIKSQKISAIYTADPNRFYRDTSTLMAFLEQLKSNKIVVHYALLSGEVLSLTDNVQEMLSELFVKTYSYELSKRVKATLAHRKLKLQEVNQK